MAEGEENQEAPAKSKSRLIIWICVAIAFVVIVGVFAKTVLFPAARTQEPIPIPSAVGDNEPGPIIEVGDFLTNLAKPDEEILISVKIAVELDVKVDSKEAIALMQEIEARSIELRQVVEEVLRKRNREDLATESGRDGMRKEIERKVNARLRKGQIRRVLTNNMITT